MVYLEKTMIPEPYYEWVRRKHVMDTTIMLRVKIKMNLIAPSKPPRKAHF